MRPLELWRAWSVEPVTITALVLAAALYARGIRRLRRTVGTGRVVARWRVCCFGLGLVVLGIALLSPLDTLGDALFAAHMVQHLLLMLVAAPLVVLGAPLLPVLWAFARPTRHAIGRWWHGATVVRGVVRVVTAPAVAWSLYVAAIWVWHLPTPYQAAVRSETVHVAEHASFFGTALLFWWVVFAPTGRRRLSYGPTLFYVCAAGMQGALLGAILTFAQRPWYPVQSTMHLWGVTPLEDQQLAGIIMWVPSSFIYLAATCWVFVEWLRTERPELVDRGAEWTTH